MMLSRMAALRAARPAARPLLARRGFATGKEIAFGTEARAAMLRGVDMLADAVQVTLGPKVSRLLRAPHPGTHRILCFYRAARRCRPCEPLCAQRAPPPVHVLCQRRPQAARWSSPTLSAVGCSAGPQRRDRAVLRRAEDHEGWRDRGQVHRVRGQGPQPWRAACQGRREQDE